MMVFDDRTSVGVSPVGRRLLDVVRDEVGETAARIVGPEMTKPLSRTWVFIVVFALYGSGMLLSLQFVSGITPLRSARPEGSRGVHWLGVVTLLVGLLLWGWLLKRRTRLFRGGLPWLRPRSLAVVVGYLVIGTVLSRGLSFLYVGGLFFEAALLGVIFEVYCRPLVPDVAGFTSPTHEIQYLEFHLQKWWRFAQISATFGIAIGVGVVSQFLIGKLESLRVVLLAGGPVGLGASAALVYLMWKMEAVEKALERLATEEVDP